MEYSIREKMERNSRIENDAIIFGLLLVILAIIFYTSKIKTVFWSKFYKYVPALLLCYFIPALLNWPLNWVNPNESKLYFMASRYLLPTSLIFLCLNIDIKGIINLGTKAIIMFLTATVGIVLGGPVAILFVKWVFPSLITIDLGELWKGFSTVAGSWIGGGANQAAMKEIFEVQDNLFGTMLVIDVIVTNIWLGFLLYGASISDQLDLKLKADNSAIKELKYRVMNYQSLISKKPTVDSLMVLLGVGFGGTAIAHLVLEWIVPVMKKIEPTLHSFNLDSLLSPFFWLIVVATTIGFGLSFTKARELEGVGASRWGSIFIYVLVATIGMKMNIGKIFDNLGLFAIGLIWMAVHVGLLLFVARIIRAPYFFVAVGSQANVGGAASAPIVASAFHPSLAPVGVLLAVLGYALGTYGALLCAQLMRIAAIG